MSGKKKPGRKKPAHSNVASKINSNTASQSNAFEPKNEIMEVNKENTSPNLVPNHVDDISHPAIKLLDQSGFKSWIQMLKEDDVKITANTLKLLSQDSLIVQNNLTNLANAFNKKFKFEFQKKVEDCISLGKAFKKGEWSPDFYSKGPLQYEYTKNRMFFAYLFNYANTEHEFIRTYFMMEAWNSVLALQEQLIIDKVGLEITNNLIKEESNLIFGYKEEIKRLTAENKFKLDPILNKLHLHETAFRGLEEQIDDLVDQLDQKIENLKKFPDELKARTHERFVKNEENINKLFGLIRKANGRMEGLHDLIKRKPTKSRSVETLTHKESENSKFKSDEENEEEEEEEEEEEVSVNSDSEEQI
jgi:hypothetical protein